MVWIDNCWMLPVMDLGLVPYPASIDRIGEDMVDMPSIECPNLAGYSLNLIKFL